MSNPASSTVPPGWYPDPAGERQWRVWTGTAWSSLTRPYGDPVDRRTRADNADPALARALERASTIGVVGVLGGLGLLVSVLAHWPGTADPTPRWFAVTASGVALALLVVGSATYALAARALRGHWTVDAVVPGLNVLVVDVLASRRLGRPSSLRVAAEVALLVVFCLSAHVDAWLGVAPVIVALGQTLWLRTLVGQLTVSTPSPPTTAS